MHEDARATVALLKVLADPIRIQILKALYRADLCVCVFVELLDCEYSKLSYHLKLLKDAGLIEYTKEGNFLIYHLTESGRTVWEQVERLEKVQVATPPAPSSR
ncbi:MAG: ArsR family transcriptional regulator [Methanophagales archaeon ANME-1-THS]|nr:MAG: ArsR family transcriptional regulator [Methanophagales archaeon ANME-1-THS]